MDADRALRDFLLDAGMVTRSQLDSLQGAEDASLATTLVVSGVLSEDEVRRALAHALGVPFVRLERDNVALDALTLIPEPLSRARGVVAFRADDESVEVAMLELSGMDALDFLRRTRKVLPRLTNQESLKRALLLYQKKLKGDFGSKLQGEKKPQQQLEHLLRHALQSGASSLHLELGEGLLARYRVQGALMDAMALPKEAGENLLAHVRTLTKLPISRLPQEGVCRVVLDDMTVRVRMCTLPVTHGEKMVLHLIPEHALRKGFSLEGLGFHGEGLERVHRALSAPGLVLVCGEEGSGKSTLLYTLLDALIAPHRSITTVEERVEYRVPGVVQVKTDEALTPASALRAALRQDPDVLMLSSIRTREEASIVVAAAARGVLVLAGIEAPSAAEGVVALRRLGAPADMLATSFSCAIGLSLAKKLCTRQFHDTHRLSREQADILDSYADISKVLATLKEEGVVEKGLQWKDVHFARSVACSSCENGYDGAIGVQEVLSVSAGVRQCIAGEVSAEGLHEYAWREGMRTLAEDGLYKAAQGQTSVDEVLRMCGGSTQEEVL